MGYKLQLEPRIHWFKHLINNYITIILVCCTKYAFLTRTYVHSNMVG